MSEETPKPGSPQKPWSKTILIGKRVPRVDAYERVSGSAVYPSDVVFPDMLYGAILRCPWPNARVMNVDTSEAQKMEGVYAVMSGRTREADIDWPYSKEMHMKLFDPFCRYEGEPVAAVAATTPYQAWDAIHSIKAAY